MRCVALCSLAFVAVCALGQDRPELGEIKTATIKAVYLRGDFPPRVQRNAFKHLSAVLQINEWIDGRDYHQLREIYQHFGHHFVLRAANAPDVAVELLNGSMDDISPAGKFVYLDAHIEDWSKLRKGVSYKLLPLDNGKIYQWRVRPGVRAQLK